MEKEVIIVSKQEEDNIEIRYVEDGSESESVNIEARLVAPDNIVDLNLWAEVDRFTTVESWESPMADSGMVEEVIIDYKKLDEVISFVKEELKMPR